LLLGSAQKVFRELRIGAISWNGASRKEEALARSDRSRPAHSRSAFQHFREASLLKRSRLTLDQNKSFSANWICRENVAVEVMTPAEEL
jgi:hypothetical protein